MKKPNTDTTHKHRQHRHHREGGWELSANGPLAKKKLEETTQLCRFIRPPGKQIQAYLKICEYFLQATTRNLGSGFDIFGCQILSCTPEASWEVFSNKRLASLTCSTCLSSAPPTSSNKIDCLFIESVGFNPTRIDRRRTV